MEHHIAMTGGGPRGTCLLLNTIGKLSRWSAGAVGCLIKKEGRQ